MTFSISWFCFVSQDLWHNIIDINPICQSVLFKVLSFIVQLFEQAVTWCPPHNITWLLRICNVFSNFISLLWNYAAQHNSTWLQTCWNIKRHAAASVNMCAGVYLHLRELCWAEHLSIHIFWQSTSLRICEPCLLNSAKPTMRIVIRQHVILLCSTLVFSSLNLICTILISILCSSPSLILLSLRTLP